MRVIILVLGLTVAVTTTNVSAAELDCAVINDLGPILVKQGTDIDLRKNFCQASKQITDAITNGDTAERRECTSTLSLYYQEMARRNRGLDLQTILKGCP